MNGLKKHGITSETPKSLMLEAGTVYKNLKYNEETSIWEGTVLGATSGGSKFSYVKEYLDAEVDGAKVKVKGLKFKTNEECSLEVNMTEFAENIIVDSLHLVEDASKSIDGKYKCYVSKSAVEESDYLENIAFVGWLTSGEAIIIILPNAFCSSGLEFEPKDKEQTVYALTFEPHADIEGNLDYLPVEIYYPQATA